MPPRRVKRPGVSAERGTPKAGERGNGPVVLDELLPPVDDVKVPVRVDGGNVTRFEPAPAAVGRARKGRFGRERVAEVAPEAKQRRRRMTTTTTTRERRIVRWVARTCARGERGREESVGHRTVRRQTWEGKGPYFMTLGPLIQSSPSGQPVSPSPATTSIPCSLTSLASTFGISRPIEPGCARASVRWRMCVTGEVSVRPNLE